MEHIQPFLNALTNPLVIGILILACLVYVVTLMLRKKKEGNSEDWKIYKNKSSDLSTEQYKKIAIAAIYSQQQEAYINSLNTGLSKERINVILGDWWQIHNPEEAMKKLNYLRDKGFGFYFPTVYKAFLTDDEQEKEKIIIDGIVPKKQGTSEEERAVIEEDLEKAYSQQNNLKAAYNDLLKTKYITGKEDLKKYGVIGWDCGRLNFVARLCYDAGYISEEQAWTFIDQAYEKAQKTFHSWQELAASYVIGRAVWAGQEDDNFWIAHYADMLLEDPKSPWKEIAW